MQKSRLVRSFILICSLYALLQGFSAVVMRFTGDERNVVGIAAIYARTGRVVGTAPGLTVISHTPAGGLVHAVHSLGGLIEPDERTGRLIALSLALLGTAAVSAALWREVSPRFAAWFLAAYGIAPWTIYHSSMAWEPGLMLLFTAVALAAAVRLRRTALRAWSGVFGWALMAAFQAYASFALVFLGYAIQFLRKQIRLSALAFGIGVLVGSITLWPALFPRSFSVMDNAVTTSSHPGARLGWGLTQGYPIVRSVGLWLRMSSSDINRQVRENSLYRAAAARRDSGQTAAFLLLNGVMALSFGSVVVSVIANVWFFRRDRDRTAPEAMAWLRGHCIAMCAALLGISAIAPVCVQGYHAIAALPAAAIPFAAWCERTWSLGSRRWQMVILLLFALRIAVTLIVAVGFDMGTAPAPGSV